ncbi:hypothetical protein Tcan_11461 [Toxocara canis]|uniref:Uncharacterized protein n=1 Tax=Toxocara canis TaxID=6265 RepID=A0A0B2V6D9_TOXCA|nr:hypothetical protein Tcan_11461 [Toxocara canis]
MLLKLKLPDRQTDANTDIGKDTTLPLLAFANCNFVKAQTCRSTLKWIISRLLRSNISVAQAGARVIVGWAEQDGARTHTRKSCELGEQPSKRVASHALLAAPLFQTVFIDGRVRILPSELQTELIQPDH